MARSHETITAELAESAEKTVYSASFAFSAVDGRNRLQMADLRTPVTRRLRGFAILLAVAIFASGCAARNAFRQGEKASRAGNLDDAVAAYRRAVQADPRNPNYAIALQRTMVAASRAHLDRAKEFEDRDQLEAALGEYRLASEYDPSNRTVIVKVAGLEQTLRNRIEAARPRPAIEALRAQARAASAEPVLNPASRDPLRF